MIVTLKYFGALTDITNKKEEILLLDDADLSVAFLKSKLEFDYKGFQNINYLVAINQALSKLDSKIKDQDIIAFLPPFAGG